MTSTQPKRINMNSDMAEGFGTWDIGNDAALVRIIRTANVACGFHAGDPTVMHRFCVMAKEAHCSIGAHPGFNDLWGFGRRQIKMAANDLEYMVAYQIGALQAVAALVGLKVTHVKSHGALGNMAAYDEGYAMALARATKAVDPSLMFIAMAGSEIEKAGERLGLKVVREGYADRQYGDDGQLAPRSLPGTVFRDAEVASEQALRIVRDGEVVSRGGKVLKMKVSSICVHGDEPTAVAVATATRRKLEAAGFSVVPLPEMGP